MNSLQQSLLPLKGQNKEEIMLEIHDLIALGDYKRALSVSTTASTTSSPEEEKEVTQQSPCRHENDDTSQSHDDVEVTSEGLTQLQRIEYQKSLLPLLLRLLSALQPLSSIQTPEQVSLFCIKQDDDHGNDHGNDNDMDNIDPSTRSQDEVNEVVALLEHVAASFQEAEQVDFLTSYLSPKFCNLISKCPSLKRDRNRLMTILSSSHNISSSHDEVTSKPNLRITSDDSNRISISTNGISNSNKHEHAKSVTNRTTEDIPTSTNNNDSNTATKEQACVLVDTPSYLQNERCYLHPGWDTTRLSLLLQRGSKAENAKLKKETQHSNISVKTDIEQQNDHLNEYIFSSSEEDGDDEKKVKSGNCETATEVQESQLEAISSSTPTQNKNKKNQSKYDHVIVEDTQESNVSKILNELVSLVISSLKPFQVQLSSSSKKQKINSHDPNSNPIHEGGVRLSISPDSLLAETSTNTTLLFKNKRLSQNFRPQQKQQSTTDNSNLPATITSLLHHIPALRHEHVANSLCRASTSIPQCATIIQTIASNSPSTTNTLVKGCIDAYQYVKVDHTIDEQAKQHILNSCKESIHAIAILSKREAMNVITKLNRSSVMPDLMIELMMEYDCHSAFTFLLESIILQYQAKSLSSSLNCATSISSDHHNNENSHSTDIQNRKKSRRKRKRCHISSVVIQTTDTNDPLIEHLKNDSILSSKVRQFIGSHLTSIVAQPQSSTLASPSDTVVCWGEATLVLQVYSGIIHCIGIGAGSSTGSGSTFVENTMNTVTKLTQQCLNEMSEVNQVFYDDNDVQNTEMNIGDNCTVSSEQKLPISCRVDDFLKIATCACIITCTNFPPIADAGDAFMKTSAMVACTTALQNLMKCLVSEECRGFFSRITSFIRHKSAQELRCTLREVILGRSINDENHENLNLVPYFNFFRWARSMNKEIEIYQEVPSEVTPFNIKSLKNEISSGITYGKEYDGIISDFLNDPDQCEAMFEVEGIDCFLQNAVRVMALRPPPLIPLILPLYIEANITKKRTMQRKDKCQIIMQLVYSFAFLETLPDSPFAIDPRTLSLRNVLQLTSTERNSCCVLVQMYILKYCPNYVNGCIDNIPMKAMDGCVRFQYKYDKVTAKDVKIAIRNTLLESDDVDSLGIEKLFLYARATQPSSEVDVAASLALLDSVEDPVSFFTYTKLCQDPTILLKCSLKVWTNEGLRRILLAIMQRLIEANEIMVQKTSVKIEVASEYLAARDSLILRCWLFILSDTDVGSRHLGYKKIGITCPLLASMIRSMITNRPGLVTSMIRQALPTSIIDWLVAYVPEIFLESTSLIMLLETGILTAVEKLHVADAALRIAITYGQNFETECHLLAYNALSTLVSSFYIVIGPVGVPANLIRDQDEKDVTQVCRKSFFRILSTVKNISDDMLAVKNEARIALSKIAAICKGDMNSSGLSGSAAQRRRAVLKDIWDTLVRVNASLGGGIHL